MAGMKSTRLVLGVAVIILAVAGGFVAARWEQISICSWYGGAACDGRAMVELVYFLTGGPLLFIVGLLALAQIKVAQSGLRQAREMETKRLELANTEARLALIRDFTADILPAAVDAVNRVRKGAKGAFSVDFENGIFTSKYSGRFYVEKSRDALLGQAVEQVLHTLNRLEHFTLCVQELDKENREIAYSVTGSVFVEVARDLLAIYVHVGSLAAALPLLKLFTEWHDRGKAEKRAVDDAQLRISQSSESSEYTYNFSELVAKKYFEK